MTLLERFNLIKGAGSHTTWCRAVPAVCDYATYWRNNAGASAAKKAWCAEALLSPESFTTQIWSVLSQNETLQTENPTDAAISAAVLYAIEAVFAGGW